MKNLKNKLWAKIIGMVLLVVSLMACAGSAVGILLLDDSGFYSRDKSQIKQEEFESICRKYSVQALSDYQNDFNLEKLNNTNFCYGVIEGDDIEGINLNDDKNYLVKNFTDKVTADDVNVFTASVGEDTVFTCSDSILGSNYLYENAAYITKQSAIEGWYFNIDEKNLYLKTADGLFCIENGNFDLQDEQGYVSSEYNDAIAVSGQEYTWTYTDQSFILYSYDMTVSNKDVKIVNSLELNKIGEVLDQAIYNISGGYVYTEEPDLQKSKNYVVVSFAKTPLQGDGSWENMDMFKQADTLIDLGVKFRYGMIAILVISGILSLLFFVFLMSAAGHYQGREEVEKHWWNKVPLDLAVIGTVILEYLAGCVVYWFGSMSSGMLVSAVVFVLLAAVFAIVVMMIFFMDMAVNVKCGKWWRNTCIYLILHFIGSRWGKVHRALREASKEVKMHTRVWLIFGLLTFFEFCGIVILGNSIGVLLFFWLIEKVALFAAIALFLIQFGKLKKGGEEIASGKMNYHIDTEKMYTDFKVHGDHLNQIGTGMDQAVKERMKSEHFKTELITNVSHDIKTPLTSIINYVDLLEKEDIDNQKAKEYLEVLERQSARLKKLIEDLIEASKASTGNLKVNMERCNAGVMLTQTIGEFEEKLEKNQIELLIKKPEEEVYLMADNRHLWRVFDNLMNNICKYAAPGTRAYVNLEREENHAVIIFRNVSKYPLNITSEELMERFVRGDDSRNTEGSGLGLSIARSLTELMAGSMALVVDGDLFKVILKFPVVS